MMKALIVDDEPLARKNLALVLERYCADDVLVVGEAQGVNEAYELVLAQKPDIVFLDIEMGKETGFDLVAMFPEPDFQVIFVTAYDQYAIKAIKVFALDYLLKPINLREIKEAVQKAKKRVKEEYNEKLRSLVNVFSRKEEQPGQVAVPVMGGYRMVTVADMAVLKAVREYTYIHFASGEVFCSSVNLGYYEDLLGDTQFYRVHHSYIINRMHIKEYAKADGGEVVMHNGSIVPVSRRRKPGFLQWLVN
jgi:two-component system, LytTR family, response regulator